LGTASPAERALAERRMREINESWRVLRDPALRRAHDAERARAQRHPTAGTAQARPRAAAAPPPVAPAPSAPARARDLDDDLVEVAPPVGPLGFVVRHLGAAAVLVLLLVIFVATAYAGRGGDDGSSEPVPGSLAVGDCIVVAPGPAVDRVPCTGPHDLRVVARVAPGEGCPAGAEARRLTADGQTDCVVPA
jgi:hypothetical protein